MTKPVDKAAIRERLTKEHDIDFSVDFHTLHSSQTAALSETARSIGYRQSPTASGSLGRSFFEYLNRGASTDATPPATAPASTTRRRPRP